MNSYRNIMEVLVEQEARRQLGGGVGVCNQAEALELSEIVSYALNRLPTLYASTKKGLQFQLQRGHMDYGPQIFQAVQSAIAAVRQQPHHAATPIKSADRAEWATIVGGATRIAHQRQTASQWQTTVPSPVPGIAVRPTLAARYRACPQPLFDLSAVAASVPAPAETAEALSSPRQPQPTAKAECVNRQPIHASDEIPTLLDANEGLELIANVADQPRQSPLIHKTEKPSLRIAPSTDETTNLFHANQEAPAIDSLLQWIEETDEKWWNGAFYQNASA